MKTRVIQDEPDEPSTQRSPPADRPPVARRTNLAGRMGRWSAQHRKIAIFGWLAFVFVSFAVGIVRDRREAGAPRRRVRASPAARTRSSRRASSSPPARAS